MPSVLYIIVASVITAATIAAGLYAITVIFEQGTDAYYDNKYNITHPEHTTKTNEYESNAGDPIFISRGVP